MNCLKRTWACLIIASLTLVSVVILTNVAEAGCRHRHPGSAYARGAYVAQVSAAGADRPAYGQDWDSWRWKLLQPHCDYDYPMHEQAPCGTATGGPVGGLW